LAELPNKKVPNAGLKRCQIADQKSAKCRIEKVPNGRLKECQMPD